MKVKTELPLKESTFSHHIEDKESEELREPLNWGLSLFLETEYECTTMTDAVS